MKKHSPAGFQNDMLYNTIMSLQNTMCGKTTYGVNKLRQYILYNTFEPKNHKVHICDDLFCKTYAMQRKKHLKENKML